MQHHPGNNTWAEISQTINLYTTASFPKPCPKEVPQKIRLTVRQHPAHRGGAEELWTRLEPSAGYTALSPEGTHHTVPPLHTSRMLWTTGNSLFLWSCLIISLLGAQSKKCTLGKTKYPSLFWFSCQHRLLQEEANKYSHTVASSSHLPFRHSSQKFLCHWILQ